MIKKSVKCIIMIIVVFVIIVFYCLFIKLTNRGFPWEDAMYKREALEYVEEKYGMDAEVLGTFYSLTNSRVYITVRPIGQSTTFEVHTPRRKLSFSDTYLTDFSTSYFESIIESDMQGITNIPLRISVYTHGGDMYEQNYETSKPLSEAINDISLDEIRKLLCDKENGRYCVLFAINKEIESESDVDYDALYPIFDYARNNYGICQITFLIPVKGKRKKDRIYIKSEEFDEIHCSDDMRPYYVKAYY